MLISDTSKKLGNIVQENQVLKLTLGIEMLRNWGRPLSCRVLSSSHKQKQKAVEEQDKDPGEWGLVQNL